MEAIQVILVLAMLTIYVAYLNYFRTIIIDRVIALILFFAGLLAVLFPDYTTVIANAIGVGRGTDLFFYIFALTCFFALTLLYSKIARLAHTQTEIIRALAIANAKTPTNVRPDPTESE